MTTDTIEPTFEAVEAKTRAEAAAAESSARKNIAEAERAEMQRDLLAIELASQRRTEQATLAADYYQRIYRFDGPVGAVTVKICMATLSEWSRTDPGCAITIVFNSPGGSVVDGMALWDFLMSLRDQGHHLTTECLGMAASMAGILLQAGDHRVIGRQSWLMIHEASFGAQGKIGEVEDTVEWVKKVQDRILDIFAERSNMTRRQIATKWRRTDWWLSSDEALSLGFVDAVR